MHLNHYHDIASVERNNRIDQKDSGCTLHHKYTMCKQGKIMDTYRTIPPKNRTIQDTNEEIAKILDFTEILEIWKPC